MKTLIFIPLLILIMSTVNSAEITDFALPILNKDSMFKLSDHLGKKTIVLNFFASWCTPCAEEIPELHSLQNKYSTDDYIFVAINSGERKALIKKFVRKYKFKYIVLEDKNKKVAALYSISSLPKTIVISKNKEVTFLGSRPPKELK